MASSMTLPGLKLKFNYNMIVTYLQLKKLIIYITSLY